MSWMDDLGGAASSVADYWNASRTVNDGSSYTTEKTTETVPMNAVQSMAPATATPTDPSWSKFMQDVLGGAVGYAIRKDAVQSGVAAPASQPAPAAGGAVQAAPGMPAYLMPLLLVGGVVVAGVVVFKLVK